MLEVDDIQHILLTRAPALTGRYEFLSFRDSAKGRAWLQAILEKVQSAQQARASVESDKRKHIKRDRPETRGRGPTRALRPQSEPSTAPVSG